MLRQLKKTAGSPEAGLPASNINAADGYENQLSATAEMINTSSARGTLTQGFFPHRPVRVESRVFLPSRNLEDFVSKGSSASSFRSISEKTTRSGNDTDFVLRSPASRKRRNKTTSALLFKNVEQKPAFSY